MLTVRFSFLKTTKNFTVFRELDSKGVQFSDDWKELSKNPERHHVGSIYVRNGDLPEGTKKIEITLKAID